MIPKNKAKDLGEQTEVIACDFLKTKGMKYIEKNFHSRFGEIDLIMKDHDVLVFVEVRYRKSSHYGSAAESISSAKKKKLIKTALFYLHRHQLSEKIASRFDVVTIHGSLLNMEIEWFPQAFDG
jgi:putative endonuclease